MEHDNNNFNEGNNNSQDILQWKSHERFFKFYYDLREKIVLLFAEANDKPQKIRDLIDSLESFIEWTNEYNDNSEELSKELTRFDSIYRKAIQIQNPIAFLEVYKGCKDIFRKLSKSHESNELTPKKKIVEDDKDSTKWWKEEEDAALREVKKGFMDVLKQ